MAKSQNRLVTVILQCKISDKIHKNLKLGLIQSHKPSTHITNTRNINDSADPKLLEESKALNLFRFNLNLDSNLKLT